MTRRFEYQDNTGSLTTGGVTGNTWVVETFTPQEAHKIMSVFIYAYRSSGSGGILTARIRAVNPVDHKPTGGDLATGTIDSSLMTASAPGQWYEITLSSSLELSQGVEYALILSHAEGAGTVNWRGYNGNIYPRGVLGYSLNAGSTWTMNSSYDKCFEEWGLGWVLTQSATNLLTDQVTGNAICDYPSECNQYGFEWGTETGVYTDEIIVESTPSENFSLSITGLQHSTWYFYRAKVYRIGIGWEYGKEVRFQTGHDENLVLFDFCLTGDNANSVTHGNNWFAQTFTPLAGHVIRTLELKLSKTGSPTGLVYVSIRNTSGDLPTGSDLLTVTMPIEEVSSTATFYKFGIPQGEELALASGVKYAIVIHIVGGDSSNCINWRRTTTAGSYTRGAFCKSTDGGVSWTGGTSGFPDNMFANYGESGVDTYPPTNVKASTATAEGFLYDPTDITQVGFEWGVSSGVYTDEEVDTSGIYFTGPVQIEISGLTHSTHYYIRAKAYHSTFGWLYGREVEFDTLEPYPEVRTDPPSLIEDNAITAVGNILDLVEGDAIERGFVYGQSSQSAPGNVAPGSSGYDDYVSESGTFGTGSFSLSLEDIQASKLYYIRAYARNSYGYGYGGEFMVLTSSVVNFIYPNGTSSQGIRFDTSPGGGWSHPGEGTIPHWQLVRTKFIKSWVNNSRWGYFITESTGGYAYEHNYYNDNMYTDLYTFENPRTRSEGILKVKWQATFWRSGYPFGHYQRHLVTHSTQYDGVKSDIGAPTNPTNICEIFYTNPNTGEQWTLDEVDAIVAGASVGESGGFGIAILDFMRIVVCWANADVRTDPAEYINSESSKLVGYVLEDEGEACTVYFEWGETTAYEHGATTSQTKSKGEFFYETLTGLVEGQTYHVRTVIVTGCGETFYGDDRTFPFLSYPGIWLGTGPTDRFLMEITDHVLGYRTEQGRDEELGHAASGIAELTCDNWDGRFSPEKTDGAYYGFLYIGAYLTIIETYGGTLYYRFSGKIDKISPHPEPDNRVGYIVAIDGMDDLAGSEIETVLRTDTDEQELLGDILDAAGWLAGMRDLDAGVDTLQLGWFHEEMALPAVNSLEDATRGFFFVDPEGNATWQNRHYRVIGDRLVSQYTFDENMIEVQYEWSKRDVKNWARVTGYKYVDPYYGLPSEDWLWYAPANSEAAPFIPASSTITIWASLQGPRKSSDALVEGTHWNANSEYDKSGDDLSANITVTPTYYGQAIKFVIENTGSSGAYLVVPDSPPVGAPDDSTLLVYGTIYEELVMTVVEEDTTSQDDYGKRTMSIDARFKSNYNDILAYAEWLIARYKDPLPSPIRIRVNPWYNYPDDALKIYTLTLKISDRVTVVSSHLGISQDYFIDKIIHEYAVNEGSWVETAEYWLSRTEGQSEGLYWILGVAGFTELGQTTRLGF